MNATVTHTGIAEEIDRADRFEQAYRRRVWEALDWFGKTATDAMKTDHPYQDRTGFLTATTGYNAEPLAASGTMRVNLYALAFYAEYVEDGTPRSRPYPFFWPKFYQFLPELLDRVQRAMSDAVLEVGGRLA